MSRNLTLRSLLLLVGFSAVLPLMGGCYVQTRGAVVVDGPPPPPRHVVVEARPGFVWVDGVWISRGGRWVWRDGYYQRGRPGYLYVQGRWTRGGGRYHWVEPRWEARARYRGSVRGRVDVRDHRTYRRSGRVQVRDRRTARPEVRDHRDEKKKSVRVRDHRDR